MVGLVTLMWLREECSAYVERILLEHSARWTTKNFEMRNMIMKSYSSNQSTYFWGFYAGGASMLSNLNVVKRPSKILREICFVISLQTKITSNSLHFNMASYNRILQLKGVSISCRASIFGEGASIIKNMIFCFILIFQL